MMWVLRHMVSVKHVLELYNYFYCISYTSVYSSYIVSHMYMY
jgi:hypothetical protein